MTANGPIDTFRLTLDSVTVGDVTILNVEAIVHQSPGLDVALLGMSFLNRTEIRNEGTTLTLVKRF
jgi:aspartyl protease family protein